MLSTVALTSHAVMSRKVKCEFMLSPSPIRQPSAPPSPSLPPVYPQEEVAAEATNVVVSTPSRKRFGETPLALAAKALLRPLFKALYYLIQAIRTHKWLTLSILVLLLAGVSFTSRFITGSWIPFSSTSGTVVQPLQGNPQLSPDVHNWLVALRDADINELIAIEQSMPTTAKPNNTALYMLQYSQARANMTWTAVKVTNISVAPDGTQDTYVEVDMTTPATSTQAATNIIVLWHFTTIPQLSGRIVSIDLVSSRQSLV